jgi:hypothetical protein
LSGVAQLFSLGRHATLILKTLKPYIFAILSAGWLLPVFLTGSNLVAYIKTELEPRISGKPFDHSFPVLDICFFWFAVAVVYLSIVIFCWSLYFLRRKD